MEAFGQLWAAAFFENVFLILSFFNAVVLDNVGLVKEGVGLDNVGLVEEGVGLDNVGLVEEGVGLEALKG